jgi:serine/threonine-protein kinase
VKVCESCRARFKGDAKVCPLDGGALVELPDPLIGRTISGRYSILEKIGAGGMGTVYRGQHEVVGRDVAIKFLSPELAVEQVHRTRFLREAKAANRIQHEHIIEITDFGETEDGHVYLVMEFLDGRPLSHAIAQGPMPLPRAIPIAMQITSALARAHELDVVHRDVKPDNIYLLARDDGSDFVKVLDFGLAHMKGELRLTATGTVFGTPEYMAPEQARGAPLTAAVDLYALGCVFFEMVTGRLPFQGTTPDLIMKHIRAAPPRPSSIVPSLPPAVDELVLRLLSKDPKARHADAYHVLEDLKRLRELVPGTSSPPALVVKRSHGSILPSAPPPPMSSQSPRASGTQQRTQTAETGWWSERVELFRSLVRRAYPRGDVPAWLATALDDLAEEVMAMRDARAELDRATQAGAETEQRSRDTRLRIGHALDELAGDESRVLRRLAELEARVAESRARLAEVARPLAVAWCAVPPVAVTGPIVTRDVAESLREAGALAAAWAELERPLRAVERDLADRRREHDDVTFQVAQLKGRLGSIHAEAELELTALREKGTRLDTSIGQRLEAIVTKAGPLVQHFMQWPELRALVLGDSSGRPRSSTSR